CFDAIAHHLVIVYDHHPYRFHSIYELFHGISTVTEVPCPSCVSISRAPPRAFTRASMFFNPKPFLTFFTSNPTPSSSTIRIILLSCPRSWIYTSSACAYLSTLLSNSCAIRYNPVAIEISSAGST